MSERPGPSSARRAVELIFAFEQRPVATVKGLAEIIDMPVPTTHRYVAMLKDMGIVEEASLGEYRLTLRVLSLAETAKKGATIIDLAQPFMQDLHEKTGETVLLIQPIGGLPVCTHRVESKQRIRLSFEIGQPLPPLRGASAHLLTAALPEDERRGFVEGHIARGAIEPTSGVDGYLEEVRQHSKQGWAVSSEEIEEGIWSAAASVQFGSQFIGTISVPCPVFRIDDQVAESIIQSVRHTARSLSLNPPTGFR